MSAVSHCPVKAVVEYDIGPTYKRSSHMCVQAKTLWRSL